MIAVALIILTLPILTLLAFVNKMPALGAFLAFASIASFVVLTG